MAQNMAGRMFAAALDSKGIHYSWLDEKAIRCGFRLENGSISIILVFGDDYKDVHLMGQDFVSIPKSKVDLMYLVCNELNRKFRWTKFYMRDGAMMVEDDAVIQLDSCAAECYELMSRMASIVDDAIPLIMKAIYGGN